jgi:uncharacterized membrane protein YbhN (UPF0104 family)
MLYKIFFKIAISCLFLLYLFFEINWPSLFDTFKSIKPIYFFISLLFALLNSFVLAQKYGFMQCF